jgi:hypothetical protein
MIRKLKSYLLWHWRSTHDCWSFHVHNDTSSKG